MARWQRILVIKHGALGDIIQGLDAYAALRAGQPKAHISLLTTRAFAEFTARMPWFDQIHTDPRASFVNLAATLRVRRLLRAGWDAILDLQCSQRTARYHRLFVPAGTRWFGTAPGASDPFPDFTGVNNSQRMLTGATMVGGSALPTAEVDFAWLDLANAPRDRPATGTDGPAVLIPGCSAAKPQKKWPADRFAALAAALHDTGRRVLVVGTATDRPAADALLAAAPFCEDLVGRTSLFELARVLRGAGLVVGNDTGPLFLAARLGAPSVMVMGPDTDPQMSAPTGPRATWVRSDPIARIEPQAVLAAAAALMPA